MNRKELDSLIDSWVEGSVISHEQSLVMKEQVSVKTAEKSGSKMISAFGYIGAFGIAGGILSIIAVNWGFLPKVIKLIFAFLLPIVPLCGAYYLSNVQSSRTVFVRVLNVIGLFMIGGTIALIGQIYNLPGNYVMTLWMWSLLSVPLVFLLRRTENVVFSVIAVGIAIIYSFGDFVEYFAPQIGSGMIVLMLTVLGLFYTYAMYRVGAKVRYSEMWTESGRWLRLSGAGIASTILFVTTFEFYARLVTNASFFNDSSEWILWSLVFNLIFIAFLVFALFRSVAFEEYSFAFSIVRLAMIYVVLKYITLFGTILHTGVFLILGGILFVSLGVLVEKKKGAIENFMRRHHEEVT